MVSSVLLLSVLILLLLLLLSCLHFCRLIDGLVDCLFSRVDKWICLDVGKHSGGSFFVYNFAFVIQRLFVFSVVSCVVESVLPQFSC